MSRDLKGKQSKQGKHCRASSDNNTKDTGARSKKYHFFQNVVHSKSVELLDLSYLQQKSVRVSFSLQGFDRRLAGFCVQLARQ